MIVSMPYINLLNLFYIIKCLFLRNMEPLRTVAYNPNANPLVQIGTGPILS